jgi:hypothetical protein
MTGLSPVRVSLRRAWAITLVSVQATCDLIYSLHCSRRLTGVERVPRTQTLIESAELYDAIYSFKNYAGEADRLRAVINQVVPGAHTLLDVACGTGEHAKGIDALEHGQVFGAESAAHLSTLVSGKTVNLDCNGGESYNRLVCKILPPSGADVDLDQIEAGMAWHYKQYQRLQTATDRSTYRAAEDQARRARIGLWADTQPVQPQDFRHGTRSGMCLDNSDHLTARTLTSRAIPSSEHGLRAWLLFAPLSAEVARLLLEAVKGVAQLPPVAIFEAFVEDDCVG